MENIIYYFILFSFVLLVRYFKIRNTHPTDYKEHRKEIFHTSLDIVYTASGVVIALILNVKPGWIPVVFAGYIFITSMSSMLEMSSVGISENLKTGLSVTIILLVLTMTFLTYKYFIPPVDINGNKTNKISKKYQVIIPYKDFSIVRHIGLSSLSDKLLYFDTTVSANNADSAKIITLKEISKGNSLRPIILNKSTYTSDIEIVTSKISVIENQQISNK